MGQIALVGKPNSGKSSLFNLLTGLYQKVGNYSGVTVERKTGKFLGNEIIDLPGIRSLWISSPEEKISLDAILDYHSKSLPILFVANGTELEDALSLFTEMADLQTNMAIIINFKDELEKNKIEVDAENLKAKLGCPVILMNSKSGEGLSEIIQLVEENNFNVPHSFCRSRYDQLENGELKNNFKSQLIQSGTEVTDAAYKEINDDFVQRQRITRNIVQACVTKNQDYNSLLNRSQKIDRFMLHPILGLLSFFFVLLLLFQAVFTLSAYPMDWIDAGFGMASEWAQNNIGIPWLADLVSQGILPGIGGVLIFIPQIAILFLLLGLLEQSGYLSRISFISDRVLQKFGLSGKSIIPLMSSWACAIPAIMSTRVINDPKERMSKHQIHRLLLNIYRCKILYKAV